MAKRNRIQIPSRLPTSISGWFELFADCLDQHPYTKGKVDEIRCGFQTKYLIQTNVDPSTQRVIKPKERVTISNGFRYAFADKHNKGKSLKSIIENGIGNIPVGDAYFIMTMQVERKNRFRDENGQIKTTAYKLEENIVKWHTIQMPMNCGAVTVSDTFINPEIRECGFGDLFHKFRLWYIPDYGSYTMVTATAIKGSPWRDDYGHAFTRADAQTRIFEKNGWKLAHEWENPNSDNLLGLWYIELDQADC
jgi:hypothetical protein